MSLLEKMVEACKADRKYGISEIEQQAWEKLGYWVHIPDLIGTNSEYLAPYQKLGFNHPSKEEQRSAWAKVKKSTRWVEVRTVERPRKYYANLQVHQILSEILSLMKKDSIFAASLMDAFSGVSAFPMLKEEGIIFDAEIASKMNKYFDATI